MRSGPVLALLAVVAVGLVVVAVAGARAERPEAFATGIEAVGPITVLERGGTVCQAPIEVPEPFGAVRFTVAPVGAVLGPVEVTVRGATPEAVPQEAIGRGVLPRGPLPGEVTVALDRTVGAERRVAVCLTNRGPAGVQTWGDDFPARTPVGSQAVDEDGQPLPGDLFVRFPVEEPPSVLERIPATFEHAAPFKLGGVGTWVFWVLAALVLLGTPALLARAVAAADDGGPDR